MKIIRQYILFVMACLSLWSCKKDNYDAPSSTLSGKLVYKGEGIGLEYDRVPFQLYQYGFGKIGSINGTFTPEGTYSSLLFNGDYKLVIPIGQGPFKNKIISAGKPDSMSITVTGNQTVDIEVEPYYMIRTPQINVASGKVNGTFKVEKIITDVTAKDIERVQLFVNKTNFVSGADNAAQTTINGAAITDPNNISMSVTIPSISPAQNYVFARVGLKVKDVEDMIFSPVVKLTY